MVDNVGGHDLTRRHANINANVLAFLELLHLLKLLKDKISCRIQQKESVSLIGIGVDNYNHYIA